MAKKETILPGYSSKFNSFARKEKRKQKQEDKKIEKANKENMKFTVLKTLPEIYYEIPNPGNERTIKRGDQFPEGIKPINAQEIELPWYHLACYKAKLLFLKKIK